MLGRFGVRSGTAISRLSRCKPRSPIQAGYRASTLARKRLAVIDGSTWTCDDALMSFEILGDISHVETFAAGSGIREIARLRRVYGRGRWRKRKGVARVRLPGGSVHLAEVHRYEAAGIGRKEFKIKHLL